MQDRFKFRYYNKNKMWHFDLTNHYCSIGDTYPVMQCTGLKDSTGKLIYEGDIAKDEDKYENYEIVWDSDSASFKLKQGLWLHELDNDIEIIGNIYENPELLKEATDGM